MRVGTLLAATRFQHCAFHGLRHYGVFPNKGLFPIEKNYCGLFSVGDVLEVLFQYCHAVSFANEVLCGTLLTMLSISNEAKTLLET